jgi:hypothetical protein
MPAFPEPWDPTQGNPCLLLYFTASVLVDLLEIN